MRCLYSYMKHGGKKVFSRQNFTQNAFLTTVNKRCIFKMGVVLMVPMRQLLRAMKSQSVFSLYADSVYMQMIPLYRNLYICIEDAYFYCDKSNFASL